jgi:hypothetical protein
VISAFLPFSQRVYRSSSTFPSSQLHRMTNNIAQLGPHHKLDRATVQISDEMILNQWPFRCQLVLLHMGVVFVCSFLESWRDALHCQCHKKTNENTQSTTLAWIAWIDVVAGLVEDMDWLSKMIWLPKWELSRYQWWLLCFNCSPLNCLTMFDSHIPWV